MIVDKATPADATTQTPDVISIDCATLDSNHCCAIVLEIQTTPVCDILTFNNVTPAEFDLIESLLSDEKGRQHSFKLFYWEDLLRLLVMTRRPIHNAPIYFLDKRCRALLAPYHLPCIRPDFCFNSPLENFYDIVIPDFRVQLELSYARYEFPIPVWIAECGFSQTRAGMEHQLERAATMFPEIDVALMISIQESTLQLPEADHPLFSRPALKRTAFTPTSWPHATDTIPPVVVEDIVWVNVKSVDIYVFLRGEDGKFDFTDGNPLSARGTLFPMLTMQSVTEMLHSASKRFLLRMAEVMEQHHDNHDQIDNLRTASVDITFPVDWLDLVQELQRSLYETAWSRYIGCFRWKKEVKRATDHILERLKQVTQEEADEEEADEASE